MKALRHTSPLYHLLHQKKQIPATVQTKEVAVLDEKDRIKAELRAAGIGKFGLWSSECRYLPRLIHEGERIKAVIYGRYINGKAMLVATDKRAIFLDTKPFFVSSDELTYEIVSGVSYNKVGLFATVILHTRIGDYKLRVSNIRCAEQFITYIEHRCLERDEIELPSPRYTSS